MTFTSESLAPWLDLLRRTEARLAPIVLAAGASMLSAVFEGVSAGLLIPTLEGALRQDLSFLHQTWGLRHVAALLPPGVGQTGLFGMLVAAIFVAVLLRLLFQYLGSALLSDSLWGVVHRLQVICLERYLRFGQTYFDEHNAGHLKSLLLVHPTRLIGALQSLQGALYWVFALVAYGVLMLMISWQLTLFVALLFPVLVSSLGWVVRRIQHTSREHAAASRELDEHAFNLLTCMPLVKASNQEHAELERFAATSWRVTRLELSRTKQHQLIYPLQEVIVVCAVLALVGLVAFLIAGEPDPSLSGYLVFFYLLRRSATTFGDLNRVRGTLALGRGLLDELRGLLDDSDKPFVPEGRRELGALREAITLENLTFSYPGGAPVLRGVTCRLERGKTTAIVGRTGSGKTTLINLLLRFYDVPPGAVRVDGVDLREFTTASLRRHIAYVSQDTFLLNHTIRANICYGNEPVGAEELARVVTQARLEDLINRHPEGLEAPVGDRGVRISGGEAQRIALARALLKRAEILVLDEATSSLDTRTEQLVQEAVEACLADRTAIVIAHRLSTIRNADWILLLEDGQLTEQGTLDDLLARQGHFWRYWHAQHLAAGKGEQEPCRP